MKFHSNDKIEHSKAGRVPEKQQLSNIKNIKLKFATIVNTNLNYKLSSSDYFMENVTIIKTWSNYLTPQSQWHFSLKYKTKNGINLNRLYSLDEKNKDHPINYVLVVEFVGDNQALLSHTKTKMEYGGYSPLKLICEFDKEIKYLTNQNEEENLHVMKTKKKSMDFSKKTEATFLNTVEYNPKFQ